MTILYIASPIVILCAAIVAAYAWSEREIEQMPEVRDSELEEEGGWSGE